MKVFDTIKENKVYAAVFALLLALVLVAAGLVAPQRSATRAAAAVVPERPKHTRVQDRQTPAAAQAVSAPELDRKEIPAVAAPEAAATPEAAVELGREIGAGQASYYGSELAGRPTANGERFDPSGLTAAHRTLPFGSRVRVTNVRNGRSVVVRINDRGPFVGHRIIDLSRGAAQQIGMVSQGTAHVELELLPKK